MLERVQLWPVVLESLTGHPNKFVQIHSQISYFEPMLATSFNPLEFGETDNETGLGELEIIGGGLVMSLVYQIVVDTSD